MLQIPSSQDTKFERYSDSSASFITLENSNTAVYKQLYRAAKAKGKLRLRVTITDKAPSNTETLGTTPSLPDRLTCRKYAHPYISDLSNNDAAPSARLSTLVDLKTASEATLNELEIPVKAEGSIKAEEQAAEKMNQPPSFMWPIMDTGKRPVSAKSTLPYHPAPNNLVPSQPAQESQQAVEDVKQATQDALRTVQDAIASRNASQVKEPWKSIKRCTRSSLGPAPQYLLGREQCRADLGGLHQAAAAPLVTEKPRPCANFTICCNQCDCAIPNAHWHCGVCDDGDFDLCEDCLNRGFACDSDDHWLIKRTVEDGKVVNSKTEIAPKTTVKVEKAEEVPGAFASYIKPEMAPSTDMSRTCNQCVQGKCLRTLLPFIRSLIAFVAVFDESQFVTCTVCEDFDLCIPCHVTKRHGHHPNHGFAPVSSDAVLKNKLAKDFLPPGRNQRHWAVCDNCDKASSSKLHDAYELHADWLRISMAFVTSASAALIGTTALSAGKTLARRIQVTPSYPCTSTSWVLSVPLKSTLVFTVTVNAAVERAHTLSVIDTSAPFVTTPISVPAARLFPCLDTIALTLSSNSRRPFVTLL